MVWGVLAGITEDFVRYVFRLEVVADEAPSAVRNLQYSAAEDPVQGESGFKAAAAVAPVDELVGPAPEVEDAAPQQPVSVEATPGRNEPCHCGSGKKYKHCHGR